ncbi:c2h2 finger domain-containing protein [Diaporthe amygdali]|uniref:c2h2 finger domain-containing protein n=1 Tax=Phomopsis amygdali TaxID=1214568 RepID=UPI0022FE2984|nr:c2h2 finger domain-containing protein [Diaporthe amygdali]KAJ0125464.1 c2h2 finger domain-containing protein [Diaporthe amygdali]
MLSNVVQGKPPSRDGWRNNGSASPVPQRPTTHSPELPRITSDIADFQRPPQLGSSQQSPRHIGHDAHTALRTPAQPGSHPPQSHPPPQARPQSGTGSASTPGRPRIEVVLDASPHKSPPHSGLYFGEADLEDELVTSDLTRQAALPAAQVSTAATAPASVTPAPPTTGKRPRGRPKGWRPGMPSYKTGLTTAQRPPPGPKSTGQKRRGRPPRQPSPTPREVWERQPAPRYVPFLCEWPGCRAELQNVVRLRKHIHVVHGRMNPLLCRWAKCKDKTPVFTQEYDFQDHVDEEHLTPFVWHVGDGQRNERPMDNTEDASEELPAYLLGPDGEQVTPSVKGQEIQDFLTWRENRRRLKKILMQRDANAPSEDDDEDGSNEEPLLA